MSTGSSERVELAACEATDALDGSAEIAPDLSDAMLVAGVLDGDRGCMRQLHDRYAPLLHAIMLARVPHSDAADLVQDVFVRALSRLDSLRDPRKLGAWLSMMARNRAIDFYRRRRPQTELSEEHAVDEATADHKVQAQQALAAIRSLPEAYREVLIMRLVEGMTGPEIAERSGLTPGSVRVNLHRGMKLLRDRLKDEATS